VARLQIADTALFIAEQPTVLAAGGVRRVMATREALRGEAGLRRAVSAGQPVYFLCDMYCEPGFEAAGSDAACREILTRFALQPVAEEVVPGRRYALFRLVDGPPTGAAAARCPRPSGGVTPG
jgi:hypothetical protein